MGWHCTSRHPALERRREGSIIPFYALLRWPLLAFNASDISISAIAESDRSRERFRSARTALKVVGEILNDQLIFVFMLVV